MTAIQNESTGTARIAPTPKAEWSPELTTFIADFRTSVLGSREESESRPGGVNFLGTLARYPALVKPFLTFNGHLLYGTTLSAKHRELLILRVAHLRRCAYEWAQHVLLAEAAGIEPEAIARVAEGPEAPGWPSLERTLLTAVDELLGKGTVSDDTWGVLAGEFDEQQLMDVVFTVGTYTMVAMALRSFGIEPEAEIVPYLPESW